jgi:hypothetical protein
MNDVSIIVTERSGSGATHRYTVIGTIASRVCASGGALNVQLIDKNIGGDDTLTETPTATDGAHNFNSLDLTAALKTSPS